MDSSAGKAGGTHSYSSASELLKPKFSHCILGETKLFYSHTKDWRAGTTLAYFQTIQIRLYDAV
jgi:hypothetical protein